MAEINGWEMIVYFLHPFGMKGHEISELILHQKNEERPFYCRSELKRWDSDLDYEFYYISEVFTHEFLYQDDGILGIIVLCCSSLP